MVIAVLCALVVGGVIAFAVLKLLPATVLDLVTRHVDVQAQAGARELDLRQGAITEQMDLRQGAISEQVQAANTELRELRELVATLRRDGAAQQGELATRLEEAVATNRQVAELTGSLREALASPKARGTWGERTAEDILRVAGFIEGVNYRKQRSVQGGSTIPDFTFLLPRDRVVHMDVKFPIAGYLRHLDASSDLERQQAAKQFVRDVRQRLKELAGRHYIDPTCTVDYLLVFIPNESVYAFIHEHDPELVDFALQQKAVLCSPTTLFPVLAVIRQAMDNFMVDQTSEQILRCLGAFTDQWEKLAEAIDKVGKQIETTQKAFGELNGPRRRAVERTFAQVDELRTNNQLPLAAVDVGEVPGLSDRRAG
ncbi:MAG: DNA recombination protein RmuC [Acidimicrobiales bacterium]